MRLKVILVEHDLDSMQILQEKVDWAALDCEIVGTAPDGDSGLALILEKKPDILLTSIRMPGKTGLEVAGLL